MWRAKQFIALNRSQSDKSIDGEIRALLADERLWSLLAPLSPFDRAHHLTVHRELVARGHSDPDLLLAALLHDVGKADHHGRAGSVSRTLRVLLRRRQAWLDRLTSCHHPRLLHGLFLAEHHARLGAARARVLGVSERCCWLIANHESPDASDDPHLTALIAVDEAVIR